MDNLYLEQCIIKTLLVNDDFAFTVVSAFESDYFDTPGVASIFNNIKNNLTEHNELPQPEMIVNTVSDKSDVKKFLSELDTIDFDTNKNYDWLLEHTNKYLKEQAIKTAILRSVDVIDEKKPIQEIRELVETALCKDLKVDLGTDYFSDFGLRIERIKNADNKCVPSFYPLLDECLNGGFIPYSFSVIAAPIHKGKSLLMANMAQRQIEHGHNVALFSMEMSEDVFAQRFDSIIGKVDINRMYNNATLRKKMIMDVLKLKQNKNTGKLFIKEFPTGKATVNHLRIYLRELKMRKINIDILFCDYVQLMQPEVPQNNMYIDIKSIAEDLRALSLEFQIPVVTATQLNREGSRLPLSELDHNYIAESSGIAATADVVICLGNEEDLFTYENEIHYKLLKNRLGSGVGDMQKFYIDTRSLKVYCSEEHDLWINDAKSSHDSRAAKNIKE